MDQVILDQKLESLRHCIKRVEEKTPPHVSQLIEDQDILVLNLTRAVQLGLLASNSMWKWIGSKTLMAICGGYTTYNL